MTRAKTEAILTSLYENDGLRDEIGSSQCSANEEVILAYAEAIENGTPITRAMALLKEHLLSCGKCHHIYTESKALLALGDEPLLPPTIEVPTFDLSFLPQSEPEQAAEQVSHRWRNWTLDNAGRLIIEFSSQLLDTLQPVQQMAFAKSGPGQANKSIFELTIDEYDDLLVTIEGKQSRSQAEECDLAISVDIPSRGGWPMLGGIQVAVRRGDLPLESAETDAFGQASITNIRQVDLPNLIVTVEAEAQ